jgi:hypothetical protein
MLPRYEMRRAQSRPHRQHRVFRHSELDNLPFRRYLGLLELTPEL